MNKIFIFFFFLCSFSIFSNANTSDTIQYTNYSKYGTIVNGVVVDKFGFFSIDRTHVFTCVRFKVLDVFKGKKVASRDTINIIYLGGLMPDGSFSDGFVNLEYLKDGRQCILPLNDSLKYFDEVNEKDFTPKGYFIWHGDGVGILQTKNSIAAYSGGHLKTLDDVLRVLSKDNVNGVSKIQVVTPFKSHKDSSYKNIYQKSDSIELKKKERKDINKKVGEMFLLKQKTLVNKPKTSKSTNLRTISSNTISFEIKNLTSIYENNNFYNSFDVYVSSGSSVFLDNVILYFKYNTVPYGVNVADDPQNLIVTKGKEFELANYTDIYIADYTTDIFKLGIGANRAINDGRGMVNIGSTPIKLFNVKIKTEWIHRDESANIDFEKLKEGAIPGNSTQEFTWFKETDNAQSINTFDNVTSSMKYYGYKVITPLITSFSPTVISAGDGKKLTINGYNFGSSRKTDYYQVQFRSTKSGGVNYINGEENLVDALDSDAYTTWTDNVIEVVIPTDVTVKTRNMIMALPHYVEYLKTPKSSIDFTPGSGHFFVQTDPLLSRTNYNFCRDHTYDEILDIEYAVDNVEHSGIGKVVNLYRLPNSKEKNGIVFRPGPNLSKNSEAMEVVKKAIHDINCAGAANISFDSENVINTNSSGGFNDYAIELSTDISLFPSEFTLGVTKVNGSIICPSLPNSPARTSSYIYINSNSVSDYSLSIVGNSYNLYNVTTHEIGHVLGLNHCNELNLGDGIKLFENISTTEAGKSSTRIMYYAGQAPNKNYLVIPVSENTFKKGVENVTALNTSIKWSEASCNGVDIDYKLGIGQQCVAPPSAVLKDIFEKDFNLYPNPTHGEIHISSQDIFKIDRIEIINAQGVVIRDVKDMDEIINIEDLTTGIYFFKVETSIGSYVKKVMLVE